jgi:hypothetical protein
MPGSTGRRPLIATSYCLVAPKRLSQNTTRPPVLNG